MNTCCDAQARRLRTAPAEDPFAGSRHYAHGVPVDRPDDAPVARTDAIALGGGAIFARAGVVITQPEPGVFVGFDSTCPHQGCTVRAIAAGTINCFCHGSRFRITDGSVAGGPSRDPLPRRPLTISGEWISLG